jgi:hypothetical protein
MNGSEPCEVLSGFRKELARAPPAADLPPVALAPPRTELVVVEVPPLTLVEPRELVPPLGTPPTPEYPPVGERVAVELELPRPALVELAVELTELVLFSCVAVPPTCVRLDEDVSPPRLSEYADEDVPLELRLGDSSSLSDGLLPEHASASVARIPSVGRGEEGSRVSECIWVTRAGQLGAARRPETHAKGLRERATDPNRTASRRCAVEPRRSTADTRGTDDRSCFR